MPQIRLKLVGLNHEGSAQSNFFIFKRWCNVFVYLVHEAIDLPSMHWVKLYRVFLFLDTIRPFFQSLLNSLKQEFNM